MFSISPLDVSTSIQIQRKGKTELRMYPVSLCLVKILQYK